ncbi:MULTISPECIES: hypothetical protein [Microbacterium]|nr:hypothetical protein [Microbacterium sp. CCH5-D1]
MSTRDDHHIDWATVSRWVDEHRPDLAPTLEPQHSPQSAAADDVDSK